MLISGCVSITAIAIVTSTVAVPSCQYSSSGIAGIASGTVVLTQIHTLVFVHFAHFSPWRRLFCATRGGPLPSHFRLRAIVR